MDVRRKRARTTGVTDEMGRTCLASAAPCSFSNALPDLTVSGSTSQCVSAFLRCAALSRLLGRPIRTTHLSSRVLRQSRWHSLTSLLWRRRTSLSSRRTYTVSHGCQNPSSHQHRGHDVRHLRGANRQRPKKQKSEARQRQQITAHTVPTAEQELEGCWAGKLASSFVLLGP